MNGFGLLHPGALWLLGALAALAFWLSRADKNRAAAVNALGLSPTTSRWRVALPIAVLLTIALGLVRPYFGFKEFTVHGVGEDIVLVVDISRSMLAADASPTRLAVAKRKVADVIDALDRLGRGDRVGIVLFAGESYFFLPLTADYGVARVFASAISTELIPAGGSALASALELVARSVDATKAHTPRILLISDGEELKLDPAAAAGALARRRLSIDALGVGTTAGHPIDIGQGVLLKDAEGTIVVTRLAEENLRRIAATTGGAYTQATISDEDVRGLIGRFDSTSEDGKSVSTTVRTYNEWGPAFGALALLVLVAPFAGRLGRRPLSLALVLVVSLQSRAASAQAYSPFDGAQRYASGDFPGAAAAFEQAAKSSPDRWDIHQALGSARYKKKDLPGAVRAFSEALSRARNGRERFESLFGRGNAKVLSGELKGAINDYDEALKIKLNDEATIYNRSVAERLLKEQQQQQQQQQQQPEKGQPDQSNAQQNQQQGGDNDSQSSEVQDSPAPDDDEDDEQTDRAEKEGERTNEGARSSDNGTSPTPTPNADTTADSDGASPPTPGQDDEEKRTPTDSERVAEPAESRDERSENSAGKIDTAAPRHDPRRLREEEAKSWLESLDEAPVLLQQRDQRRREQGDQTW